MAKKHNYSAGPCILPDNVFQEASEAVLNFNGIDLSILEISHRSKDFVAVMEEARSLVKELLNLPSNYEVLFLQGGASLAFLTTAYNYLPEGGKGAYIDTGTWSSKAIKEAKHCGSVDVIASSKESNYNHIPTGYKVPSDADYLHFTSNNTIFGTQFQDFPSHENLICDMSSDIFSREFDASKFTMIYAGAQKNMGPAGTVLYIFDKDKLGKTGRDIPSYLDLGVHLAKDSMFNTPPVFSVYVSMLTLRWMKEMGGISAIQARNDAKAELIYKAIDENPLFTGHAQEDSRSKMNVTFRLTDDSLADDFNKLWQDAGINGLKGHRSVGGYRASMYNALPIESVKVLTEVMDEFARVKA
ncbi:MAG: 3-phosphoserine/phosphohydroxythreonine transaminase [Flavobacteriales bacterium]|nr:3-phosphoserine/phosphohydroxythreonine transaminase [Flavobacteriales bacterium]